jgi:hypothetical protein
MRKYLSTMHDPTKKLKDHFISRLRDYPDLLRLSEAVQNLATDYRAAKMIPPARDPT